MEIKRGLLYAYKMLSKSQKVTSLFQPSVVDPATNRRSVFENGFGDELAVVFMPSPRTLPGGSGNIPGSGT